MKDIRVREKFMQHVFIVGAKGFTYGGYETFLDKLTAVSYTHLIMWK